MHNHLAHALGGAHHVGGIDRLVRGHHHEPLRAVFLAERHQVSGAEHIVVDSLDAVAFHQRHMLVRRGVDDNLRMVFPENPLQRLHVGDGANFNPQIQPVAIEDFQLLLHIVGAILVNIEDDDLPRLHLCQLPAQLRADGPAAAGDENHLATVIRLCFFIHDHPRLAEQKLLNVEVAHGALAARRLHGRIIIHLDFAAGLAVALIEGLLLRRVRGGNGENNLLDFQRAQTHKHVFVILEHGNAMNLPAHLFAADVHKAPRQIRCGRVVEQFLRQAHADPPRADDGHLDPLGIIVPVPVMAGENPENEQQQPAHAGFLVAALVGIAVDHADCQRAQQVQRADGQCAHEDNLVGLAQHPPGHAEKAEGNEVRHQQPDVALYAAIAPDLPVNTADNAAPEHTDQRQRRLNQNRNGRKRIIARIDDQQKDGHNDKHGQVIDHQLPFVDSQLIQPTGSALRLACFIHAALLA